MHDTSSFRKMLVGAGFFCATCIAAVIGYSIAGWSLVDSLYMVVITIFGVGYGEVQPINTPSLKFFTAIIIIAGCSSGIYVVGGFVQMIAEGEIQRALGVRRMSRGIEQTTGHVIICGFGRVGQMLASELKELDEPFVCVDSNPERIAMADELGYLVVTGNAGEEETLERAGIERARVLATVLPDDAANVFITLTARELSEEIEIIARGESTATQRKLVRSGANHIVLPAAIGASKIANMISCPNAASLLTDPKQSERLRSDLHSLGLSIHEYPIDSASNVIGSSLSELQSSCEGGMMVVAIQRADGTLLRNPESNQDIRAGDTLFIVADYTQRVTLTKATQMKRPEMRYRGQHTS
ncbi:Voltage-gated potassium channel Kch [Rubripirellula amarantea]|uniref:Voltage-gated potassium channel Kch n=1 Tax=Rubripirellula amarantea TaxID=2527999 RepID=A0A5C5WKE6_9BACT|nr:potassium channel protein [Rubripirellula amarantea]TWT50433.1 Voltage-gated potassium channel Kch [Rubripirellula amarantea]